MAFITYIIHDQVKKSLRPVSDAQIKPITLTVSITNSSIIALDSIISQNRLSILPIKNHWSSLDFCTRIKALDAIFLDLEVKIVTLNGCNSMLMLCFLIWHHQLHIKRTIKHNQPRWIYDFIRSYREVFILNQHLREIQGINENSSMTY